MVRRSALTTPRAKASFSPERVMPGGRWTPAPPEPDGGEKMAGGERSSLAEREGSGFAG
jgi:hypothetical protein